MTEENGYPTVTELDPPSLLEGEYKQIKQVIGQRLLIQKISDWRGASKYGDAKDGSLIINALTEDQSRIFFFTNHDVLYHKFDWLRDKPPFVAVIYVPEGARYYDVK